MVGLIHSKNNLLTNVENINIDIKKNKNENKSSEKNPKRKPWSDGKFKSSNTSKGALKLILPFQAESGVEKYNYFKYR